MFPITVHIVHPQCYGGGADVASLGVREAHHRCRGVADRADHGSHLHHRFAQSKFTRHSNNASESKDSCT